MGGKTQWKRQCSMESISSWEGVETLQCHKEGWYPV